MPAPRMTAEEIGDLLHAEFPQAFYPGCGHSIERVGMAACRVRWTFDQKQPAPRRHGVRARP